MVLILGDDWTLIPIVRTGAGSVNEDQMGTLDATPEPANTSVVFDGCFSRSEAPNDILAHDLA